MLVSETLVLSDSENAMQVAGRNSDGVFGAYSDPATAAMNPTPATDTLTLSSNL